MNRASYRIMTCYWCYKEEKASRGVEAWGCEEQNNFIVMYPIFRILLSYWLGRGVNWERERIIIYIKSLSTAVSPFAAVLSSLDPLSIILHSLFLRSDCKYNIYFYVSCYLLFHHRKVHKEINHSVYRAQRGEHLINKAQGHTLGDEDKTKYWIDPNYVSTVHPMCWMKQESCGKKYTSKRPFFPHLAPGCSVCQT